MEVTRESVNQWLAETRRSQTWLAEQCEVSKQAVSNWLREKNPQPISAEAKLKIMVLFEEDAAKAQARPQQNLVLEFTDEEFTAIENAAVRAGIGPREWARCALNEAAEADMEALAAEFKATPSRGPVTYPKRRDLKVAEGEPLKPKRRAAGE